MTTKMKTWRKVLRKITGNSGATFIEYAMLAGLVAIVVAIAVAVFGKNIRGIFQNAADKAGAVETGVGNSKIDGDFSAPPSN